MRKRIMINFYIFIGIGRFKCSDQVTTICHILFHPLQICLAGCIQCRNNDHLIPVHILAGWLDKVHFHVHLV